MAPRANAARACSSVAVIDPTQVETATLQLDALASEATEVKPAYGTPASLAALVRARAQFFARWLRGHPTGAPDAKLAATYALPVDFYTAYHVPYFAIWATCEQAALLAALGKQAHSVLEKEATRAPNRGWLLNILAGYR